MLIAKPGIHVSTKFVYTNLKAGELKVHPDIDGQIQALEKRDLHQVAALMGNVLETVTIPAYPVIQQIKDQMMEYGALNAMRSAAGPPYLGYLNGKTKRGRPARH